MKPTRRESLSIHNLILSASGVGQRRSQGATRNNFRGVGAYAAAQMVLAAGSVFVGSIFLRADFIGPSSQPIFWVVLGDLSVLFSTFLAWLVIEFTVKNRLWRDEFRFRYPLDIFDIQKRELSFQHDPRLNESELRHRLNDTLKVARATLESKAFIRDKLVEDVLGMAEVAKYSHWVVVLTGLCFAAVAAATVETINLVFISLCGGLLSVISLLYANWFRSVFIKKWEEIAQVYEDVDPMELVEDYVVTQQSIGQIRDRAAYLGFHAAMNSKFAKQVSDLVRGDSSKK